MSAESNEKKQQKRVVWKHIGLHGHAVGTFLVNGEGIQWKSAILSNNEDMSISRVIPKSAMKRARWTVFGRSGHLRIETNESKNLAHELRFDGFPEEAFDRLKKTLQEFFQISLEKHSMSANGTSYGKTQVEGRNLVFRHMVLEDANEEGEEFEPRVGHEMMSLDLTQVSQCVLPGNTRHELEIQFPESDAAEAGTDQLISIRFYIPPDADYDNHDKSTPSNAELFHKRIMASTTIKNTTGNVICEFPESQGTFLTPRGRYHISLYEKSFRMRGRTYDCKIKYDDISRLFLLPKPDDVHMAFVISLDKPIQQGQQRYRHLVLQVTKEQAEVTINLEQEELEKQYKGNLQQLMKGSLSNLIAKTFKVIADKKVFIPGKFANANQQACVKCALRANEGLLYPLEKQFVFIHKAVLIRFEEIESVEFQRYAGGQGSTRNFDLCVRLKTMSAQQKQQEYVFSGIDRTDYTGLYNFLNGKKIKILNLEGVGAEDVGRPAAPIYNEDQIYGVDGAGDEEESEDEDFDANAVDEDEDGSSDDMDDDDLGSEIDDDLDSDLEDARKQAGITKKKKPDSKPKPKKDDVPRKRKSDSDGTPSPPKKSKKMSSKPSSLEMAKPAATTKTKKKSKKDPNAPKKSMSAYMFYMRKNRNRVKEQNPQATFGELAKLVSAEYKTLDAAGKQEYLDLEAEDKQRYKKEMENYTPPPKDDDDDDDGGGKAKGKKGKKKVNADGMPHPKKPLSAYNFFMKDVRSQIKEEQPDIAFGDITKEVSRRFKLLDHDGKEKYDQMAKEAKMKYKREMEAYNAVSSKKKSPDGGGGGGGLEDISSSDSE